MRKFLIEKISSTGFGVTKSLTFLTAALLAISVFSGCDQTATETKTNSSASGAKQTAEPAWLDPKVANPQLPVVKLWLGPEEIEAELAATMTQIATGMMFRESLDENKGMLFAFSRAREVSYYMKNTKIPLTAAYINAQGKILELHDLEPFNEESVPSSTSDIQFVLEMNQGWFKRHNVGVGALVTTDKGALITQIVGGSYFQ